VILCGFLTLSSVPLGRGSGFGELGLRHFDPSKQTEVKLEELKFLVLYDLVSAGEYFLTELNDIKDKGKTSRASATSQLKRKVRSKEERDWGRKAGTLREREPR
jgi:hypothetical protein